ncbi:MAG TPA: TonB family protein [Candidatus Binatia bacterium]
MEHASRSLATFFAASLALHLAVLLLWSQTSTRPVPQENVIVSLLPAEEQPKAPAPSQSSQVPPQAPTRNFRSPAIIAKKNSPAVKRSAPEPARAPRKEAELKKQQEYREPDSEPVPAKEPPRPPEKVEENLSITERRLPTMRELLPPANWSSSANNGDEAIALNTRDPQYITYFTSIKRNIEFVWEYPEPALRYGLQGKLLLQFTILASGELESAQIIRSSGSNLLDHEALRAMKAAAPFRPIPPWIDKKKITITASFEYLDNRLNYRVTP